MSRLTMLGSAVAFMLAVSTTMGSAEGPKFDPDTMMSASEIEPGMQAVGKTVFSGVDISEFRLRIIGVLPRADLGKDVIVAKILDGPIVERHTGVLGGMSGSPVYVNGKLIGAISLAWPYEKEAITGITTIEAMLEAFEGQTAESAETADRGLTIAGHRVTRVAVVPYREAARRPFVDEHTIAMCPAVPLVYCSGFAPQGMQRLADFFTRFGIEPLAGPGTKPQPVDTDLVPGAAVGVQLASGDFDITSIGTVTYRAGDTILAFGHPLLELGDVQFPLTTAWVYDFVPSYYRGNKLASPMKAVGTLTRDCGWAVGGIVGDLPTMIPVSIKVTDRDHNVVRRYHVRVAQQRMLAPAIVTSSVLSALNAGYDAPSKGTVDLSYTVVGTKGARIHRTDTWPHSGTPDSTVVGSLSEAFDIITQNRFEPQDIKSVEIDAAISSVDRTATIEKVYTDQSVAKAGEQLTIHVVLRPNGGERFEKVLNVELPADTPTGTAYVSVAGGINAWGLRSQLGMLPAEFESLQSLIEQYETLEENTELMVGVILPSFGIRVGDMQLMDVPGALQAVLNASPRTDLSVTRSGCLKTLSTGYVVQGSQVLVVQTLGRKGKKAPAGLPRLTPGSYAPPSAGPPEPGADSEETYGAAAWQQGRRMVPSPWLAASAYQHPLRPLLAPLPAPMPRPADTGISRVPPNLKTWAHRNTDSNAENDSETDSEQEAQASLPAEDKGSIIRRPSLWVQTEAKDFQKGKIDGSAIRSDGAVYLSPRWTQLASLPDFYVWCFYTAADGKVFVGTGSHARLYRLDDEGPQRLLDTPEFAVHAITALKDNSLVVGTSPRGKVYRITADGKTSLLCDLDADYVWCLSAQPDGSILAGTGPHGKLFKIDTEGQATQVADLPVSHIVSFARLEDALYMATAGPGAVYCLRKDGSVVPIFEAGVDDDVAQLAACNGALYLATSIKGRIYKLAPDGKFKQLYDADGTGFLCLAAGGGRLYAGMGKEGKILCLVDDNISSIVYSSETETQVMALGTGPNGELYAALPNPARILLANNRAAAEGIFISSVLDAKRQARWGRIRWWTDVPAGCGVEVWTRSGNSYDPDDGSWSAWSGPYQRQGEVIASPPARYLQYRLKFTKPEGEAVPALTRLQIAYLPDNQPPKLQVKKPTEVTAIRGKYDLEWEAKDPDNDKLETAIYIKPLQQGDWQRVTSAIGEKKYELDTTKYADGVYCLKFVVSDRPSNPTAALTDEQVVSGITIDNTAPLLEPSLPLQPQQDSGYVLSGSAYDAETPLSAVLWQVKGADQWRAAAPDDGLYDENFEQFTLHTGPLPDDAKQLVVRARDSAGNVTDKAIDLPAQKPAPSQAEESSE